jgi:hypothetical protein
MQLWQDVLVEELPHTSATSTKQVPGSPGATAGVGGGEGAGAGVGATGLMPDVEPAFTVIPFESALIAQPLVFTENAPHDTASVKSMHSLQQVAKSEMAE